MGSSVLVDVMGNECERKVIGCSMYRQRVMWSMAAVSESVLSCIKSLMYECVHL